MKTNRNSKHLKIDGLRDQVSSLWGGGIGEEFENYLWQERNSISTVHQLRNIVGDRVSSKFLAEVERGLALAPMAMRLSPYLMSLIDWSAPQSDPIRRQFLPLSSEMIESHPLLMLDSLCESSDAPVEGLVHRYSDRGLFLATDRCPVYCRFCTRSYAVGNDTNSVTKSRMPPTIDRWKTIFDHIRNTPTLCDIVVSGGDVYRLKPKQIKEIGETLLSIQHIRRIRFASKGLAVLPMKIWSDSEWLDTLTAISDKGRHQQVEVSLHTHFNHPREITNHTCRAVSMLFERGIRMRNQSVLLTGVNDDAQVLKQLIKLLSDLHVQPYYVYLCDLVEGIEDMRVPLWKACELEKAVRGVTAGYNTPAFVVDTPGGGGKRIVHSYEEYDIKTGISIFTAPAVKAGETYVYPDPLRDLSPEIREAWRDPSWRKAKLQHLRNKAINRKRVAATAG